MEGHQLLTGQQARGRIPTMQTQGSDNNNGSKRVTYEEALTTLHSLFPNMEKDVISCVLQANNLGVETTIDALLSMSLEGEITKTEPENSWDDEERSNREAVDFHNTDDKNSKLSLSNTASNHSSSSTRDINTKTKSQRKKRKVRVELPDNFLRVPGYPNGYGSRKGRESRRNKTTESQKNDEELQIMTDEQLALILQDELFLNEVETMMRQEDGYQTSHLNNVNRNTVASNNSMRNGTSFNMNLAAMGDGMKKRISAMYSSFKNRNTGNTTEGQENSLLSQTNPPYQNSNKSNKNSDLVPLMSPEEDSDDDEEEVIFFGSTSKGSGKAYNGKASFGGVELSDFTMSPSKYSRDYNSTQGIGMSGSNSTPSRGPGGNRSKFANSPNVVRVDQSKSERNLAHGPWDGEDSDEEEEEMAFDGFAIGTKTGKRSTNSTLINSFSNSSNSTNVNPSFANKEGEINTESLMESSDESEEESAIYSKYNYKPKKSPTKRLLSNTSSNRNANTSRQSLHQHQNLL